MAPTTTAPSDTLTEVLARAYRRAMEEELFAYPQSDGRWACKQYTIDITGPRPLDVECDCADAVFRERVCKHAISVVFCRLYGLLPFPAGSRRKQTTLPNCLEDFLARMADTAEPAVA